MCVQRTWNTEAEAFTRVQGQPDLQSEIKNIQGSYTENLVGGKAKQNTYPPKYLVSLVYSVFCGESPGPQHVSVVDLSFNKPQVMSDLVGQLNSISNKVKPN